MRFLDFPNLINCEGFGLRVVAQEVEFIVLYSQVVPVIYHLSHLYQEIFPLRDGAYVHRVYEHGSALRKFPVC